MGRNVWKVCCIHCRSCGQQRGWLDAAMLLAVQDGLCVSTVTIIHSTYVSVRNPYKTSATAELARDADVGAHSLSP